MHLFIKFLKAVLKLIIQIEHIIPASWLYGGWFVCALFVVIIPLCLADSRYLGLLVRVSSGIDDEHPESRVDEIFRK